MNPPQKKNMLARICVYLIGMFLAAMGAALAINSGIGISPISSFPFVLSLIFDTYIGIFVALQLILFVLLQLLILRRDFKWIQVGQLLSSVIFGFFIDLSRLIIGDFLIPTYFGQLLMLAISIILLSSGVFLYVTPRILPVSSDGLILALVQKVPKLTFARGKILLDCTIMTLALLSSFLFLGEFYAIREGTILAAIFVGRLIPVIRKILSPTLRKIGVAPMEE